jgi:hypothetical protein
MGSCSVELCGQVVRIRGYRFRGPEFDSRRYHVKCPEGLKLRMTVLASTSNNLPHRPMILER